MIYELIGKIFVTLGIVITILMLLFLLGILAYLVYNQWLIKVLDWKHKKSREDLFYFIKHKKVIKEYIKNKKK